MNRIGVATWITIGTLALGGVVWAVRLEGRVNANDQAIAGVDARHKENIAEFRDDLRYIRGRLDQVLDGRRAAPTSGTSGSSPAPAFLLKVAPRVGFAPADVLIRLQVEPGGFDRQVLVELMGPHYSSSLVNIRRDPTTPTVQHPIWYRSVSAGDYVVAAVLSERRCDGCSSRVVLARQQVTVEIRPRFAP